MKDHHRTERHINVYDAHLVAHDLPLFLVFSDYPAQPTPHRRGHATRASSRVKVDAKHHLVVTHEVTNEGMDRAQLASMGQQTQEALGTDKPTALADRGYYAGPEILKCEQVGINALVPKSHTSNNLAKGLFDKRDFRYIPRRDEYRCPAGQRAIWRMTTIEHGQTLHWYWSSACPRCPIKAKCTMGDYRRVTRWEHEAVLEAMQARLERMPEAARIRRQTAEHVFGTLKSWMGTTHFLMKRLPNVKTEMSLHLLAYNLKRAMQLLGVVPLMNAMRNGSHHPSGTTGKSYGRLGLHPLPGILGRRILTSILVSSGGEHVSPYKGIIYGEGWGHSIVGCLINSACAYLRALRRGRRSLRAD